MMRKNHASLSATLAACMLLLSAASSWANDAPPQQAVPVASVPASAMEAKPVPTQLAWDRVGIAAFGFSA